jgi:hypothetical protein
MSNSRSRGVRDIVFAVLLCIVALGAFTFFFEAFLAILERDAPMSSLPAAVVALVLFLWCARTSWRLLFGRKREEQG